MKKESFKHIERVGKLYNTSLSFKTAVDYLDRGEDPYELAFNLCMLIEEIKESIRLLKTAYDEKH